MADKAEKPKTVTVEALQWHTYNGKEYNVGDTYDIDEQLVDSVAFQGKAVAVDRVARAKAAAKPAKPAKATKTRKARR
jgi:arginine/lysine/ornithine decarboxylase